MPQPPTEDVPQENELVREPGAASARVVRVETEELAELYAHACAPLIGLLTVVGGDRADAEEVAQESFVRLLQHWPKVRTYDDPEAWVRSVAVRLLISRKRRLKVARLGLQRLGRRASMAAPTDPAAGVELSAALAGLPVEQRAVLVLHHVCDLPVQEVADRLHVPVGTVKSRLSRARTALAPLLADEERSTT
ncbi:MULTISPECIES: RNA polymerase sigma factor [unclassified Nocardioides]|uniref:RNA polymerase sigma factor n=1 Tax=unclassified Nocardioides TaxID=2615069 RepID=UPI0009E844EA|nr:MULTISPECIES: sigma-70 family RNA polymerase sigma factor [unclassified Nocardioides]